jgi:hypothetical protein
MGALNSLLRALQRAGGCCLRYSRLYSEAGHVRRDSRTLHFLLGELPRRANRRMDMDRRADTEQPATARQYEERGGCDKKFWDHNNKSVA